MNGQAADRAFWEWMDAYVDEPHNSQYEVPDMQRAFEAGQAAVAAQQPQPDRSLLALVDAHFVGNGPYPLQLVCWTEDASDVECDTEITEVEPGVTWDELEARIVAHAAECHAAARAQTSLTLPDTTPQPAPMVRLTPCPAEGHDGAHIQWNSSGHWLCGQQVADALGAQIPAYAPFHADSGQAAEYMATLRDAQTAHDNPGRYVLAALIEFNTDAPGEDGTTAAGEEI